MSTVYSAVGGSAFDSCRVITSNSFACSTIDNTPSSIAPKSTVSRSVTSPLVAPPMMASHSVVQPSVTQPFVAPLMLNQINYFSLNYPGRQQCFEPQSCLNLELFNGDIRKYHLFKRKFIRCIENSYADCEIRMSFLEEVCVGAASEVISGFCLVLTIGNMLTKELGSVWTKDSAIGES